MTITLNRIRIDDRPRVKRTSDRRHRILIHFGLFSFYMSSQDAIRLANDIADALETP